STYLMMTWKSSANRMITPITNAMYFRRERTFCLTFAAAKKEASSGSSNLIGSMCVDLVPNPSNVAAFGLRRYTFSRERRPGGVDMTFSGCADALHSPGFDLCGPPRELDECASKRGLAAIRHHPTTS